MMWRPPSGGVRVTTITQPLINHLGISSAWASFYIYNTKEDCDKLVGQFLRRRSFQWHSRLDGLYMLCVADHSKSPRIIMVSYWCWSSFNWIIRLVEMLSICQLNLMVTWLRRHCLCWWWFVPFSTASEICSVIGKAKAGSWNWRRFSLLWFKEIIKMKINWVKPSSWQLNFHNVSNVQHSWNALKKAIERSELRKSGSS